jgi:hypothetical protein
MTCGKTLSNQKGLIAEAMPTSKILQSIEVVFRALKTKNYAKLYVGSKGRR